MRPPRSMTSHRNGHAGWRREAWEGENLEKTIKFYQEYNNCEVNQQLVHSYERAAVGMGGEDGSFSASVGQPQDGRTKPFLQEG